LERRIVTTLSPVYGGFALARTEDLGILFIRGALPGEEVEVRLGERKKDYAFADTIRVLSPSPYRVDPPCVYFGECGGCQLQHAAYLYQVEMKRGVLEEAFRRSGERTSSRRWRPSGRSSATGSAGSSRPTAKGSVSSRSGRAAWWPFRGAR
jgi:tRNA/tmRNA/rRNA uracil-C5-methylase (TrmA/RlmC/RlmD family)